MEGSVHTTECNMVEGIAFLPPWSRQSLIVIHILKSNAVVSWMFLIKNIWDLGYKSRAFDHPC